MAQETRAMAKSGTEHDKRKKKSVQKMTVAAHSLESSDVPAVMVEVADGDGYAEVKRKIEEGMMEHTENDVIEITEILHDGSRVASPWCSSKSFDFYGFSGEPVLFRSRCKLSLDAKARRMPIKVRTPSGETIALTVHSEDTLDTVMFLLHRKKVISLHSRGLFKVDRLFYGDRLLVMRRTLPDYQIRKGSILHLARVNTSSFVRLNIKTLTGLAFSLRVRSLDTVDDVKQLILDHQGIPPDQQRLIHAGRQLVDDCTLFDADVQDQGTLLLALPLRGGGCPPTSFADVSNSRAMKKMKFSKIAPDWRVAESGLCLEGQCKNPDREAHEEMVVLNNHFSDFDLTRGETKPCPMCEVDVAPITCAFNDCIWSYKGKKAGEKCVLTGPWTKVGKGYHRFDESDGAAWERLLIKVRPRLMKDLKVTSPKVRSAASVSIDHTWQACTICTGGYETEVTVLQCGHLFHAGCLTKWANSSANVVCPNCRESCTV